MPAMIGPCPRCSGKLTHNVEPPREPEPADLFCTNCQWSASEILLFHMTPEEVGRCRMLGFHKFADDPAPGVKPVPGILTPSVLASLRKQWAEQVCNHCYRKAETLHRVQDPASGPFFLGGTLIHPLDVCTECRDEIVAGQRDQLDEEAAR